MVLVWPDVVWWVHDWKVYDVNLLVEAVVGNKNLEVLYSRLAPIVIVEDGKRHSVVV